MKAIKIYTDGGSRGNPGPAASGAVVLDENEEVIAKLKHYLGIATNNVAEYKAVLLAYEWLAKQKNLLKNVRIDFFLDSLLVCSQLSGAYKIKDSNLIIIRQQIAKYEYNLMQEGVEISYSHIRREFNKQADAMVNLALDENKK